MYDLAIIGLGPAGIEAASIALKNNLKVIAFECSNLGGTCLNQGCIPTKSILHCAEFYKQVKSSSNLGISIDGDIHYDWKKILNRKNNIVSKFNKALDLSFSKKLTLIKSKAIVDVENNEIVADNVSYKANNIIIATGSKPIELSNLKYDNDFIINSDDLFNMENLPKSVAIIGSGAIGLEWAKILSDFNVEVKLIEKAPNIAPLMDCEIQKRIERILKTSKIDFYKNDFIVSYKNNLVKLNSGVEFNVDKILCCVGRKPVLPLIIGNNEKVDLIINNDYSTQYPNIFVIGDANKELMLAHNATYQAKVLLDNILFDKPLIKKQVPSVIYITPEIASVGIREQDIKNLDEYKIKKIMVGANAKSWCDEANDGIVKVIIKNDLIVGAHVASKEASSLISIFNILIDQKIKIDEIKNIIFPHPTFSEIVLEVLKND